MTRLLINIVNKKYAEGERRDRYSVLSVITGLTCNILLFAVKLTLGVLTGAVSVIADAVNNLSDCVVNAFTLTGTKLSAKPGDREHPFGHGRIEYVTALITAISVFVVSFELGKSAVERIIRPTEIRFDAWYIAVLCAGVLVKLWMAYFNSRLYRLTDNLNLKGVMQDSINDALATSATVISVSFSHIFNLKRLDGAVALLISVFVFISGVRLLKEVMSPLLGEPPSKEISDRITQIITENDAVLGVHDLMLHSYGVNRILASADAEVDGSGDIYELHSVIDEAERRIRDELNITICIHMDPVDTADFELKGRRKAVEEAVRAYNPSLTLHDFSAENEDGRERIRFDLSVPYEEETPEWIISGDLSLLLSEKFPDTEFEINTERPYV